MAKELRVRCTLLEEILGTASNNPEIHSEFIASKAPDAPRREEEIAAIGVDAEIEKGMTVFPRNKAGQPIMWDYQIRGFFKESCGANRKNTKSQSAKVKSYKKQIDLLVFVAEREIPFMLPAGMGIGSCQRPLRAQTAQGERISLANSETIPAGTEIEFSVITIIDSDMAAVKEWLDYGLLHGFGCWRNSSKGRFIWEPIEERDADPKQVRKLVMESYKKKPELQKVFSRLGYV